MRVAIHPVRCFMLCALLAGCATSAPSPAPAPTTPPTPRVAAPPAPTRPGLPPLSKLPPSKERACASDADCTFLPALCPRCDPCTPTWRSVGNHAEARRLQSLMASIRCSRPTCPPCGDPSHWLGDKAVCANKQCEPRLELQSEPDATAVQLRGSRKSGRYHWPECADYRCKDCTVLFSSKEQAERAGYKPCDRCKPIVLRATGDDEPDRPTPTAPYSRERACKTDRDCQLAPPDPCRCPACGTLGREALNREGMTARRALLDSRGPCPTPSCSPCVTNATTVRAVCRHRQCAVR
jgi:hypothetical protein